MPEIRFWSKNDAYAGFSNFAMREIVIDGQSWPTTEHFYHSEKTLNPDEKESIREASTPGKAKRLGRKVELRPDWEEVKDGVMLRALRAKFDQHPDLATMLLGTGICKLIEDSPYDPYWGGRLPGSKNRLGELLMRVRDELFDQNRPMPHDDRFRVALRGHLGGAGPKPAPVVAIYEIPYDFFQVHPYWGGNRIDCECGTDVEALIDYRHHSFWCPYCYRDARMRYVVIAEQAIYWDEDEIRSRGVPDPITLVKEQIAGDPLATWWSVYGRAHAYAKGHNWVVIASDEPRYEKYRGLRRIENKIALDGKAMGHASPYRYGFYAATYDAVPEELDRWPKDAFHARFVAGGRDAKRITAGATTYHGDPIDPAPGLGHTEGHFFSPATGSWHHADSLKVRAT